MYSLEYVEDLSRFRKFKVWHGSCGGGLHVSERVALLWGSAVCVVGLDTVVVRFRVFGRWSAGEWRGVMQLWWIQEQSGVGVGVWFRPRWWW